jgi:hypothetical protein
MRIEFGDKESSSFKLEQLASEMVLSGFCCSVAEYNDYLTDNAIRSRQDNIALTWVLRKRGTVDIAAYMSLVADAIKLSIAEKELHNLNYPFKTIPAMKIAKLAVSQHFQQIYHGIGSFMIKAAHRTARMCSNDYFSVRFLTVDADIEHDKKVLSFYKKNGFILNNEFQNKNRKTISMRLDLYSV